MLIGALSAEAGASPRSVRHYERLGLISSERLHNGYRNYDDATVEAVRTIKRLLALGFPTELIASILPCTGNASNSTDDCSVLVQRIQLLKDDLDSKIADLTATRDTLITFLGEAQVPIAERSQ